MKIKYITFSCFFIFLSINVINAQQNFFSFIQENIIINKDDKRVIIPKKYKTLKLDIIALNQFLNLLPDEKNIQNFSSTPILEIPMPDGTFALFNVWQSSIMQEGLANNFPTIKTFLGQGITDKFATIRFDMTELGFHAMILSSVQGNVFIDPYNQNTITEYISYYKKDFFKQTSFKEYIKEKNTNPSQNATARIPAGQCNGAQLRTYRLAVGCSHQYSRAATGQANPTKAQAMSAITTTINRVVGVYEKELSIRMVLVANNQNIVYVNPSVDTAYGPRNSSVFDMLDKSVSHIPLVIGTNNFDIGHSFFTGEGGVALLGSVCDDFLKSGGVTGRPNPVGDPFDIDYVAHEIGHQFGAEHTFNADTDACNGNANNTPLSTATNCEPGSGTSIMAYAGICGVNDLQPNSDAAFHSVSIAQILDFSINDLGNNCAVVTNTNNLPPVVNAGLDYTIPTNTPFILTGTAIDPNNDPLTYSWDQMDVGGLVGNWDATQTVNIPLFRSFLPQSSNSRTFPLNVMNPMMGERLPSIARVLKFRLTVRDNKAAGGGTCFDDVQLNSSTASTPFTVTSQSAFVIWRVGESRLVTWNRGTTQNAPFNVSNVSIELSTDGGITFPITLLATTPNDGSENITVPNNLTTTARVRVRSLNNVFFNLNSVDFEIAAPITPVKWISFIANKIEEKVQLNWKVSEVNNQLFIIEKSYNALNFESIGIVNSKQNNSTNEYFFSDKNIKQGKTYYRIKQIDKDGTYSYSNTISLFNINTNNLITVYPNPTKNILNVFSTTSLNSVSFNIYNALGKIVKQSNFNEILQNSTIQINTTGLPKGVYTLQLQCSKGFLQTLKIILE